MKTIFKLSIILGFMLTIPGISARGQLSVNTDQSAPDASAMLDVKSAGKGMLTPRMTAAQRIAIISPATGLLVYQTDGNTGFYFYNGSGWDIIGLAAEGSSGNVTDVDGNVYPTIKIGNQIWMAENLRATHNSAGDEITKVTSSYGWAFTTYGAYCWYGNIESNKTLYGALYNWEAVNGNTGYGASLCPIGWHIPTSQEWATLLTFLGPGTMAGGKMKTDVLWNSPNTGATNISAFSARPGGYRSSGGVSTGKGDYGNWWSATATSSTEASYCWMVSTTSAATQNNYSKKGGFSVRCIKN